jgi:hypothetical protein
MMRRLFNRFVQVFCSSNVLSYSDTIDKIRGMNELLLLNMPPKPNRILLFTFAFLAPLKSLLISLQRGK